MDERGWTIADQYGYGPALWVAPVLDEGAREREVSLPRGDWIDLWTGERHRGGGELLAAAPLDRIPVYARAGSIVVTYPADHVARGLGDTPEAERPLGGDALRRAAAGPDRRAPGGRHAHPLARGRDGCVSPEREVAFRHNPGKQKKASHFHGRRAGSAG